MSGTTGWSCVKEGKNRSVFSEAFLAGEGEVVSQLLAVVFGDKIPLRTIALAGI